ncbi:helix-turn-helix domain-containing protein [Saccharibacillus alkalitolerans]|uniref:Helix-turn-helix transcriptional regulator n=1 Tax=Saccharibacillus alkalitolerans TaxID=2705290 RepID=A0ABX0F2D1_9BACL|nr:helix-turn-helix transcriptional regulator [Saccharibacillus alkalitolerans]NGZ74104.1 helix-turn-helix transcriptional regulator [Saccharibacillus alkalitolerans]
MEMTMTLRSEIEKGIAEMGMNFSEFGEWSGINRGIFSAILNSNPPKPISLNQLERIAKALGHEEGWMFERYIDECFYDGRPNRRRVEPFLIRCAELGRVGCIETVLSRLLEDLRHLETIFEIAEALYADGKIAQSVVFYQCIVQNEKYHQSERLAISHYRLFWAALGDNSEQNLRAAIEFEPFCDKLPDDKRLDGLMRLVNIYVSLDKREEIERYSRELYSFSQIVYRNEEQRSKSSAGYIPLKTRYPLVVYYGYGLMAMQEVNVHRNEFAAAKTYIEAYEDLSWFVGLDEAGRREVEKFAFYARANRLNLELLLGNQEILEECAAFVEQYPNELLQFASSVLKSANKYKYSADFVFERFAGEIEKYLSRTFTKDKAIISFNCYCDICYQSSLYFLERKEYAKMFGFVLKGMETVVRINNKSMFIKLAALFERYRDFASAEQQQQYKKILGGISEHEENDG